MPTAFDRLEYAIPGSNGISLDKKLADQIRKHFNTDRENRFQLFLLAAGIRNKYLNKKQAIILKNLMIGLEKTKWKMFMVVSKTL